MCMQCRKIRNDDEYWQTVEQYFHDHIGVDFSARMSRMQWKIFTPNTALKASASAGS